MKFQVKFKANGEAISAIDRAVNKLPDEDSPKCLALADSFIQWNKNITIEFDTETGTATVVPV